MTTDKETKRTVENSQAAVRDTLGYTPRGKSSSEGINEKNVVKKTSHLNLAEVRRQAVEEDVKVKNVNNESSS